MFTYLSILSFSVSLRPTRLWLFTETSKSPTVNSPAAWDAGVPGWTCVMITPGRNEVEVASCTDSPIFSPYLCVTVTLFTV